MKIAIIGHGFVGKAVDYGFPDIMCEKFIFDPLLNNPVENIFSVDNIDFSFVCVPTPMGVDGSIDSSIIENVLAVLKKNTSGTIIIKSTITPDIISKIFRGPHRDRIVYNPEFLTEKSANEDFVNPFMHIFGGNPDYTSKVEELYKYYSLCKPCPVYHMSAVDASFVKYGVNSYLASKVLWFNQFYDIVNSEGANFGKVISAITADSRVGRSHTTVPGFDGKRGFGGACFPKDTMAFLNYSKKNKQNFSVLETVIRENNNYRKGYEKDTREIEQNINFDIGVTNAT
jgi:UDPglucose 6-dehydrogenase